MKSLKQYLEESSSSNNNSGTGAVDYGGTSQMHNERPMSRLNTTKSWEHSKFGIWDCISVDPNTYDNFKYGKVPFSKWVSYVEDPELKDHLQKLYYASDNLLIKNAETGLISFIKKKL